MMSDLYVGSPYISYEGGATFVRVCSKCGRFVKADKSIKLNKWTGNLIETETNATCKNCGRVNMPFEGFL